MTEISKCAADTFGYMSKGRGKIPVRVYFALECAPLAYRTFGGKIRENYLKLTDDSIESAFGGGYLLNLVTGSAASRFLHAQGSVHSLYIDGRIYRFFERHGLLDCGLWDSVNFEILDRELYDGSFNYFWAYSACKPYATFSEIELAGGMPILFHDSDLVLRRASDKILGLRDARDAAVGVGHLESAGTSFYPEFGELPLPSCFELSGGRLTDKNTGLAYSTNLPAVNTCLMYFSDLAAAHEWAVLFRDLMKDNHAPVSDFLKGEQLLLCADQRPALMTAERRGLELMKDVKLFVPVVWTGKTFENLPGIPAREWHYYRPEYLPPDEHPEAQNWNQDIMHSWIQKKDIENHAEYDNYMGRFHVELLKYLAQESGLDWRRLEQSLRSFRSLDRYFELYDSGKTIEELLESGVIDNVLKKESVS